MDLLRHVQCEMALELDALLRSALADAFRQLSARIA
jgi:hypothetical protein